MIAKRALALFSGLVALLSATSFDVASVKRSPHSVGPDYNNQLTFSETGLKARNATLKRLVAEAYRLQMNQVLGPSWLDDNEYDIEAQADRAVTKDESIEMLRSLLADRFALKHHNETRNMRAYELTTDKGGPKIQPMKGNQQPTEGSGFHFHGNMRQLADLIAVQLTIQAPTDSAVPARASGPPAPVLDKTNLPGTYDFRVDLKPELGADGFTIWKEVLQDQLGLRLDSRKGEVPVLVVDSASRIPTEN